MGSLGIVALADPRFGGGLAPPFGGGGFGLWLLTNERFTLWQTIYFALITVSTVGFAEPPELEHYPGAQALVAVIIVSGVGAIAFFESYLWALLTPLVFYLTSRYSIERPGRLREARIEAQAVARDQPDALPVLDRHAADPVPAHLAF